MNRVYPFKFSIIMSVYNVVDYITDAVFSILKQSIGFEDNVQIIFVNDGSTDESGDFCRLFQEAFPDNVKYIEKPNGGLSSARNVGIEYAEGELLNFFDPDDLLSQNALEEVYKFYEDHSTYIDFISIPLVYFEGQKGLHAKYKLFGKTNRIINLIKEPYNFMLSAAATFYKASIFETLRFDESLITAEDTQINTLLEETNPQFGYVCQRKVTYHYRRRLAGGSNVDKLRTGSDIRAWTGITSVFESVFGNRDDLRDWEKEIIAYELRSRIRDLRKEYLASEEEYEHLLADYSYWIAKLDNDFILNRSRYIDYKEKKELFLRMKGSSLAELANLGQLDITSFKVWLKNIQVYDGTIIIEVLFNTFGCSFDVAVLDSEHVLHGATDSKDLESSFDKTIGGFTLDNTHYRRFELPLKEIKYTFCFTDKVTNYTININQLVADNRPPFMNKGSIQGVVRSGYRITLASNALIITPYNKSNLTHGVSTMRQLIKQGKPPAFLRPFSKREKKYILICDRPQKAGDNGQALFEHIMQGNDKVLKRNTYFVLDKNCPDYNKLKMTKHVIQPRSLKHKLLFLNSKVIASSHNARNFFLPFAHGGRYYADLLDYKFLWLQHGVTKDNINKQANRLSNHDDIITVCSPLERQEFLRGEYFYSEDQIVETGFARFDNLYDNPKNIITVAPTWRIGLSGPIGRDGYHQPLPGFEETAYYQQFAELLSSNALNTILEQNNLELHFLLHPGTACYQDYFEPFSSKRVRVIQQEDAKYQDIFSNSILLITDYSSTAFDFAYLHKPVIYFQFDEDVFFSEHYSKGYFDYREHGFGPVVTTVPELVETIRTFTINRFKQEVSYQARVDSFFSYFDKNNCSRIVDVLKDLYFS